ncbi:M23 family metallopeptidase [Nocardia exalbida]|uniref:M23 family metallopeptidase n=1 Tax=Nocardia exalbida TaxID=290231 RepID=UPI0002D79B21|nr:M23 family metallopeptidase [Nocardia exalbida]
MNHSSTFASDDRLRSGHRYRPDDEPFAPAARHAGPSFDQHHAGYEAAPQAEYDFRPAGGDYGFAAEPAHDSGYAQPAYENAAYDNAWDTNSAWSQQNWAQENSWSDGGAWNSGDAWAEQEPWTPDEKSWVSDTGCWAPEESWATETPEAEAEADEQSSAPVLPTVIRGGRSTNKRGGAHRVAAPPAALKGRAAVAAVAAGAVVAAGQAAFASPEQPSQAVDYEAAGQIHEIAAQSMNMADPTAAPDSPQVLNVSSPAHLDQFNDILQKGQKYAEDLAAQESAKLRPLFTKFAAGTFTSGFGARWGVQHLGIDIAGPIGTPIYAVADGTVLEAGPASGFGMWVRLLHDDGTVTIYGHIDTATVSQGQRVLAGDQIATIGNRGFSTGPHCHFEVWLNGVDKVDPLPWLATRGISLGPQRD